ncbi:MAG: 1-phosphofructokinase family hexose kinase, partial [Bryobacteraceae bacterium]
MITTLTINPAVDRTVTVDKLVFEDRAYITGRSECAGGRGINASQVIHTFGGKTLALLTAGGAAGERMKKSLARMGFPYETVDVKQESRVNATISDKQGLTVKLNELGAPLEKSELKQIRDLVEARLAKTDWLMICGSIPPGVAPHFYCEVIEMARKRGVKALVDTDGDALQHCLESKPTVVSPNQPEAERLLGRALITRSHFIDAINRIKKMGPASVILSLGSRGAVGLSSEGVFEALAPRVETLC